MKTLLLLLTLNFIAIMIVAQNECITPAPLPPQWIFNQGTKSTSASLTPVYTLNTFIHIVRSSTGQGLSSSINSAIINSLNTNYQLAGIQFSLIGFEYINNDNFYGTLTGKESQLFATNTHCNSIDIYVLGTSTIWTINGNGIAGSAQSIPSKELIIHGNYYNTSSLPHEMGHCLGLYHTHHGTVNEQGGDINQCAELVNGSNSTVCGDYISDTPADPNQWSSSSCSYIGSGVDGNGAHYTPSLTNLMSYAYKPCRTSFSSFQQERMRDFIDNTQLLQNVLLSSISGSSDICSSTATFTVDMVPAGATVIWSCSWNLSFDHQIGNPKTFTTIGSGSGYVQATINSTCGSIALQNKTVWIGGPVIYQSSIYNLQDMGYSNYYKILTSTGSYPYSGTLTVSTEGGSTNDAWSFYANIPRKNIIYWNATSNTVEVSAKTNNAGEILKYTAINTCGSSYALYTFFTGDITPPPPPLVLNPNPAGTQTEVSIPDENTAASENATTETFSAVETSSAVSTTYTLTVLNSNGVNVYSTRSSDKKITVPTSSFINGLYVVVVTDGSMIYRGNLLVSH